MTEPTKRRRWLQFSIRMTLIVVTIVSVWLNGSKVKDAHSTQQTLPNCKITQ